MPTNTYFKYDVKSEQDLYEDLVIESLQLYGQDFYYIPRQIVEQDDILNEEVVSKFTSAYPIEMYVKDVEGFQGNGELLTKFGLQISDEVTLVLSRKRFDRLFVQVQNENDIEQTRPLEGDLIYIPFSEKIFEVRFVEDEVPFFQLNKVPVWELKCEIFRYESQKISTGIDVVDKVQEVNANATNVYVTVTSGTFVKGESVILSTPSGIEVLADCINIQNTESGKVFSLASITYPDGKFVELTSGTSIIGATSEAEGVIGTVIGLDNAEYTNVDNDKYQDNDTFEKKKLDFIDFSTNNPFGEM